MDIGRIGSAILFFLLGLIEVLLGFRFIFKLLAANSSAEFTTQIYDLTDSLVSVFAGVFPSFQIGDFTLEISTLLAMIVFGVFGFVFIQLLRHFEGMKVKATAPSHMAPPTQPQYYPPQQMQYSAPQQWNIPPSSTQPTGYIPQAPMNQEQPLQNPQTPQNPQNNF